MAKKYCFFLLYVTICMNTLSNSASSQNKRMINWHSSGEDSDDRSSNGYQPYQNERTGHQSYVDTSRIQYPKYSSNYYSNYQSNPHPNYEPAHYPTQHHTSYAVPFANPPHMSHYRPYQQHSAYNDDCICGVPQRRRTRIVQGEIVSHREFPWAVQILKHELLIGAYAQCVGALITLLHILAAAHCFVEGYVYSYVRLSDGIVRGISWVDIHERFNHSKHPMSVDLSVAWLDKRILYGTPMVPICLPMAFEDFAGYMAIAIGWGKIREDGPVSLDLRKVKLPILTREECNQSYYKHEMPEYTFCAGYLEGGPDTCKGDSGGPIMVQGEKDEFIVAGVIAYGEGCGRPGYPGVNMKISSLIDWIMEKIGSERLCRRP